MTGRFRDDDDTLDPDDLLDADATIFGEDVTVVAPRPGYLPPEQDSGTQEVPRSKVGNRYSRRSQLMTIGLAVVVTAVVTGVIVSTLVGREPDTTSAASTTVTTLPTPTSAPAVDPGPTTSTTIIPADTTAEPTTTQPSTSTSTTSTTTSSSTTTTTSAAPSQPALPLGPPENLGFESTDHNSFRITWTPPTEDGSTEIEAYELTITSEAGDLKEVERQRGYTSYLFDGISGTRYTVSVRTRGENGQTSDPVVGETTTSTGPPDIVENVQVELATYSSIRITWMPPTDDGGTSIETYHIKITRPEATGWQRNYNVSSATLEYVFHGSTETTYAVSVFAENEHGRGLETPATEIATSSTRPGPPQNLRLGMTDNNSFRITWEPPAQDGGSSVLRYYLTVSAQGSDFTRTYTRSSSETRSFVFDGEDDTKYTVEVSAANKNGRSSPATRNIGTGSVSEPGLVRNLYVGLTDNNSFRIRWDPPEFDGGSPILYYNLTVKRSGEEKTYRRSSSEATSFVFNGKSSKKYTVSIRAENRIGNSDAVSKQIETTPGPPNPPTNLSLELADEDSVRIRWDEPSEDGGSPLTSYRLTISHLGNQQNYTRDISKIRSFLFDGEPGSGYTVYVRAINQHGESTAVSANIKIPS